MIILVYNRHIFFEIVENCFFTRTFGIGHDLDVGAVFRFVGRMTFGLDICVGVGLHLAYFGV